MYVNLSNCFISHFAYQFPYHVYECQFFSCQLMILILITCTSLSKGRSWKNEACHHTVLCYIIETRGSYIISGIILSFYVIYSNSNKSNSNLGCTHWCIERHQVRQCMRAHATWGCVYFCLCVRTVNATLAHKARHAVSDSVHKC